MTLKYNYDYDKVVTLYQTKSLNSQTAPGDLV